MFIDGALDSSAINDNNNYYYYYYYPQNIFCIISLYRVKIKAGLAELRKERTGGGTNLAKALQMVCTLKILDHNVLPDDYVMQIFHL